LASFALFPGYASPNHFVPECPKPEPNLSTSNSPPVDQFSRSNSSIKTETHSGLTSNVETTETESVTGFTSFRFYSKDQGKQKIMKFGLP
jgi:hypothetical protein